FPGCGAGRPGGRHPADGLPRRPAPPGVPGGEALRGSRVRGHGRRPGVLRALHQDLTSPGPGVETRLRPDLLQGAQFLTWRPMVQAAPDEVLDDGVGVVGRLPGDADLAGADASDGPVGDAGARVVACGRFGSQPDAVTVGDRGQPGVGLIGDVADANRVALAFAG